MVTRVVSQETVNRAARQFIESAQNVGEECVALTMYHVGVDAGTQPRCSYCFDQVYGGSDTNNCVHCFGTTFEGGVRKISRAWAIFTDNNETADDFDKRGEWIRDERRVEIEAYPTLLQHDYLVRILEWGTGHTVKKISGYYSLGVVQEYTLREGSRLGQQVVDKYGQSSKVQLLPSDHVIYNLRLTGREVQRWEEQAS